MSLTVEDRIRQRAYFLSVRDGGAGDDTHYWLMAEREVLAEIALESVPTETLAEPAFEAAPTQELADNASAQVTAEVAPSIQPADSAPAQPAKQATASKAKKPSRKPASKSAKAPAKSAAAATSTPTPANVTPITAANKNLKQSIASAAKSRARAAAR